MATSPLRISSGAPSAASLREAALRQPQPGLDLGRAGGVEQDVVDAPLGGDGGEAALGHDEEHRAVDPGGAEQPAQRPDVREVAAAVDEHGVGGRRVDEGGALRRGDLDLVEQQAEGGQHLGGGLEGIGQQQQAGHRKAPLVAALARARHRSENAQGPEGVIARVLTGRIAHVSRPPPPRLRPSGRR